MGYQVVFSGRAKKDLKQIDSKQRKILLNWIATYLDNCPNPRAIEGSKQLKGTENGWRFRVGSYRILASLIDSELIIELVRIGHRQGVYQNLPKL